jgi:Mrp family chromosome partitioning ATPase
MNESTDHLEATLPDESAGHEQYNELGFILELLWRRKYLVAAFCAVGLLVGSLVAISIASRYTSQVVIQARFVRPEPQLQSEMSNALAGMTLDADSIIQTEINFIRSRDVAEDVVTRLGLANDPSFAEHPSMLHRARDLITFWQSRPSSSATSRIAAELLQQLDVTNDSRSLLIRISYTSTSPEQSALIANAFAKAYLRTRAEKEAQRRLADLTAVYGPKHPSVLRAKAQLEEASRSPSVSDSAQILAWASPPVLPSGPNRRLIFAVSFICSFAAGIISVLILEWANTSFRTDAQLAIQAKAPCLGIFAEDPTSPSFENASAIAAGFGTQSAPSKTLLVTCSVPEEGAILVSVAIARSLVQMGRRVLLLDLSREAPKTSKSIPLKNVLDGLEHHALLLDEQLTVIRSASDPGLSVVTSRNFSKLLEQAREKCDRLIIAAPPVTMSADALYLGRQADFVLHVVRWNSTPRRAVRAALGRLRNFGIAVDGVILSRVHERELERLMGWKNGNSFGRRMKLAPIVEAQGVES